MSAQPSSTPITKRAGYADILRVLAIVGVVFIHAVKIPAIELTALTGQNLGLWALFATAKTCIPLFVMLSGTLLLARPESEWRFWQKRATRLLAPWLFWSLVYLLTKYNWQSLSYIQLFTTLKNITTAEFSFLPAVVCLYLLTPYFNVLITHATPSLRWRWLLLWFVSLSVLPFWRNSLAFPAIIDNGLVRVTLHYSGYYLLGYELKTWLQLHPLTKNSVVSWLSVWLGSMTATVGWQLQQPSLPPLWFSYVAPGIVVASVSVYVLVFNISNWLQKQTWPSTYKILQLSEILSKASFGVFFIHPLFTVPIQKLVSLDQSSSLSLHVWTALLTLYVSFVVVISLQQLRWLRKLVS